LSETRQIQTPGAAAAPAEAPVRRKPGPPSAAERAAREAAAAQAASQAAAAAGADTDPDGDADLSEFESDTLPPVNAMPAPVFTPEQQAFMSQAIAAAVAAAKSAHDPATAAKLVQKKLEGERLPTTDAARAMCEDMISRGQRPRAILTTEGWYTHPEMTRSPASLNGQAVAALPTSSPA
jgi:hypothetical protein